MAKEITYNSCIAEWIEAFIKEKKSLGYAYYNEAKWMRSFDSYWDDHGYGKEGLSQGTVAGWMEKRDCEGIKCLATRISVVRQYSNFLNGLGIESYCPPLNLRYPKAVIHLPTSEEISDLFARIDAYMPKRGTKDTIRMANEYPVLFRLIYLNGMRVSEACHMSMADVDLENGILRVIDGKGNRDRLVYLSEDMTLLCRKYVDYIRNYLGESPLWLFPGGDPNNPISYGSVSSMFRRSWLQTSFAKCCDKNPTTHCLRHAYVVKRIDLWRTQGLDFEHMLPYISKFLGHKSFDESFYYYHYAEEAAQTIRAKDTIIGRVIPEVMRR